MAGFPPPPLAAAFRFGFQNGGSGYAPAKFMPTQKNPGSATPPNSVFLSRRMGKARATWLGWPHNAGDWPGKLKPSRGFMARWCGRFPPAKTSAHRPAQGR